MVFFGFQARLGVTVFLGVLAWSGSTVLAGQVPADPAVDYASALCGPKPAASISGEEASLSSIQKNMSPPTNQGFTNWCGVFSALELLNYLQQMSGKKNGNAVNYSTSGLISVIDAYASRCVYEQKTFAGELRKLIKPIIDAQEGSNPLEILLSVRDAERIRSERQVPFTAVDFNSPDIENLGRQFLGKHPEVKPEASSPINLAKNYPDFYSSLLSWKFISSELFKVATEKNLITEGGSSLGGYATLARRFGEAEVPILPYVIHQFITVDPLKYLRKIHELVTLGLPMQLNTCIDRISSGFDRSTENACVWHALVGMGAGYLNGVCTIRLKNSWGLAKSTIDLTPEKFIKAAGRFGGRLPEPLQILWIADSDPRSSEASAVIEDDDYLFVGSVVYDPYESISGGPHKVNGLLTGSGTSLVYKFGKPFHGQRTTIPDPGKPPKVEIYKEGALQEASLLK